MAVGRAAAIAGGVAAVGAYLNAKFHVADDVSLIYKIKSAEREYAKLVKEDRVSPWYIIAQQCHKYADNRAIWSRQGCYTFKEFHDQCARYAQWLLDQGVRPGDLVAVYLWNSPEFMMLWFAMLCIGAAPAFINYNLEGEALLHCLAVCETKLLVAEPGCSERIEGSRAQIGAKGTKIIYLDDRLKNQVRARPAVVPGHEYRKGLRGDFPYALIYTSGTTGLPKGCAFTTSRVLMMGPHMQRVFGDKPGVDCWYSPMPLYHGTGAISTSTALLGGIGVAIAPRFSVTNFWNDIHDSSATWFVYVGETARYLLNAPPHPLERKHVLRGAYGNGLRPDVWHKFQERFNIPEIGEFFNSTEGMFALLNYDKGPFRAACVGHHGLLFRAMLHNVFIPVKIDHETGDIWRDPVTGFGKRMSYDEGGEMVVAVPSKEAFQGYWRNPSSTNKKFVANVFKEGDLYYRSGDALRRDKDGKWFFLDRLGDTFRWKSENVSTAEVSECLGKFPGVNEANVYGVLVPNHEGRAGCAALHIDPDVFPKDVNGRPDYNALMQYARQRLPKYAVPVFLRVVTASTHIHNHKQNKVPLRQEGVDPNLVGKKDPAGKGDAFFWTPTGGKGCEPFNSKHWQDLESSRARL